MLSLVDEAEKVLTTKTDLNEFGRLLDYTWKLKRGISSGISTDSIDGLYAKGIEAGALGGKLLGAGRRRLPAVFMWRRIRERLWQRPGGPFICAVPV